MKTNKITTIEGKHSELNQLKTQIENLNIQLENQKREITHLRDSRDELFMQLRRFHGLRAQIRSLVVELYIRLNAKIDNIGKFKPNLHPPDFPQIAKNDESLRIAIDNYDNKAFSQKRTIGGNTRRIVSRYLKLALSILVILGKGIFKTIKRIRKRGGEA